MKKEDALELDQLPAKQRKRLIGLPALAGRVEEIREEIKVLEEEGKVLRRSILDSLTAASVEGVLLPGDIVVSWGRTKHKTLSRPKLLQLGVAAKLLDAATVETLSRPFVKVQSPRSGGSDGEDF